MQFGMSSDDFARLSIFQRFAQLEKKVLVFHGFPDLDPTQPTGKSGECQGAASGRRRLTRPRPKRDKAMGHQERLGEPLTWIRMKVCGTSVNKFQMVDE